MDAPQLPSSAQQRTAEARNTLTRHAQQATYDAPAPPEEPFPYATRAEVMAKLDEAVRHHPLERALGHSLKHVCGGAVYDATGL